MLINRATEYSVLGLMYLARNPGKPIEVKEIAKKEKISESYLEKVFQKLSEWEMVKPKFGPGGGFELRKKPSQITVLELMQIFQLKQMKQCVNFKQRDCGRKFCPFRKLLNEAKKNLYSFFKGKTIQDLLDSSK